MMISIRNFGLMIVVTSGLFACGQYKATHDPRLPDGTLAGISFQGKGIVLFDKAGKPIRPVNETRKGEVKRSATIRMKKINPCVIEWCPDGGVCQVYVIPNVDQCPAWW